MKSVIAGGGIVFKFEENGQEPLLLLIYRRGCWDLPKGKKEDDESIPMCAAREVSEELGISIPSILSDIGTSYHEYQMRGREYGKTTYWYAMFTPETQFTPQVEEEIEKVKWFSLSEAQNIIGYENLKPVLESFRKWYSAKGIV